MPDEHKQIKFNIEVSTSQAKNSLDDLKREMKKTKDEIYKAEHGKSLIDINALKKHLDNLFDLQMKHQANLTQDRIAGLRKESQERAAMDAAELKRREAIAKADGGYRKKYSEVPAEKQVYFKDDPPKQTGYVNPGNVANLKEQFAARQAILEAQERTAIESQKKITKVESDRVSKSNSALVAQDKLEEKQFNRKQSRIESLGKRYSTIVDDINAKLRTNTKISELAFEKSSNNLRKLEGQLGSLGVSPTQKNPLAQFGNYGDYTKTLPALTQMVSYGQQLSNIRKQQELLHQQMISGEKTVGQYKREMNGLSAKYVETEKNLKNFNKSIGLSSSAFGTAMNTVRRHMLWVGSGIAIGGLIAIPAIISDITRETEVLSLKIKQNLELSSQYHNNAQGLTNDVQHLTEVAGVFATGYGANVKDVMDMMQVLSRRFKSPEELTYYTNLAMIMHKLDFVEPKKAAEDLEAVILSMGLDFQGARKFIDEFSVAVHTARITGTELLSGIQRSGAVFHNMNFNTAEAIAMISTLSTVTAKAGANIGAALNSIMINVDFKKAAQALKAYSVEVYDSTGKMRDGVEIWRDISKVFNGLNDEKANEFANAMSGGKFRANDLRAMLSNWETFEKILSDIQTKASPELTASLLQTGMESFNSKLLQLQASLQVFGITLGNEVLPGLKDMVVGLTTGVQWLNDHRDAVSKTIHYLGLFAEMLMSYKVAQVLANTKLKEFIGSLWSTVTASSSAKGAITSLGSRFGALAKSIGAAYVVMKSFQILADAMSSRASDAQEKKFLADLDATTASDGRNRERSITKEEQAALDAIKKRDAFAEQYGTRMGNGSVGFWDFLGYNSGKRDEFDRLNEDARQKVAAVTTLGKVNAQIAEAEELLKKKDLDISEAYDKVEGQDLGGNGKSKDALAPTDPSFAENKLELKRYTKNLFNILDNNKAEYQEALEDLGTYTSLFGENSVEAIRRRQQLEQGRMLQIQQEMKAIEAQKSQLESVAGDIINQYPEMKQMASISGSLPTESGVDIDNVNPAVKSAASALIQEISSQLGVTPVVTSGYREGDPGGHGSGDKLDIAWDNMQWGSDEFNAAVRMAEKAGFSVYTVPHGTGVHLDLNGSSLQGLTELSQVSRGISQEDWNKMSKQEKIRYKLDNREESQDNSMLGQTLSQLDDLQKKANEKTKEFAKMQAEITKGMFSGVFDKDIQRQRALKSIDTDEAIQKSQVNTRDPLYALRENNIALSAEARRYQQYKTNAEQLAKDYADLQDIQVKAQEAEVERIRNLKDGVDRTKELAEAIRLLEAARRGDTKALQENSDRQQDNYRAMEESARKQKELANATALSIRQYQADIVGDFLDSADGGRSAFKKILRDMQNDALNALFDTKKQASAASSFFGTMGKSGSKANASGISGPAMANGSFYKNSGKGGKHATGGIINAPTLLNTKGDIGGEDGEEVIIPTERNTQNSEKLLKYASNKLGFTPETTGGTYVPYFKNPELATQPIVNVNVQQTESQNKHLIEANALMREQNQMLMAMVQNGGNNGNVVVMPVAPSSEQVMDIIAKNPAALANIMGRNKSSGWR